jgi:hypothetical protein
MKPYTVVLHNAAEGFTAIDHIHAESCEDAVRKAARNRDGEYLANLFVVAVFDGLHTDQTSYTITPALEDYQEGGE